MIICYPISVTYADKFSLVLLLLFRSPSMIGALLWWRADSRPREGLKPFRTKGFVLITKAYGLGHVCDNVQRIAVRYNHPLDKDVGVFRCVAAFVQPFEQGDDR